MAEKMNSLVELAEAKRPFLVRELLDAGFYRMTLSRFVSDGRLHRPMRGVLRVPYEEESPFLIWACVAKLYPQSLVCMLSAASYHGLTEAMAGINSFAVPNEVHPMDGHQIEGGAKFIRLRNARDFSEGVQKIIVENTEVSITSPERTIVDLFRYSSYFKRSSRIELAIDAEGFQDALQRYLDSDLRSDGGKELRRLAKSFGVWEPLKMVIETTQSVKAQMTMG